MITDPNWLFSTAAQSAAAFVAIIAGFVVSRLLALSAEKNGLESRLRDIRAQLHAKNQALEEVEQDLLWRDASDFFDGDILDRIIENKGDIALSDLMNETINSPRTEEDLRPFYGQIVTTTKEAFQFFQRVPKENEEIWENLDGYLGKAGLRLSDEDIRIYYRVFGFLEEQKRPINQISSMLNINIAALTPAHIQADELNSYRQLQRDINLLEREKKSIEKHEADLVDQLKHFGKPRGAIGGLLVLFYFSVVSIIIPLALIPMNPEHFTLLHKWGIFGLFVSGVTLFFIYLVGLVIQLSK